MLKAITPAVKSFTKPKSTLIVLLCTSQVFVALLRISQPDGRRAIIRQALDVLTPALVRRLPQGENRYPIWIRWGLTSVLCQAELSACSNQNLPVLEQFGLDCIAMHLSLCCRLSGCPNIPL